VDVATRKFTLSGQQWKQQLDSQCLPHPDTKLVSSSSFSCAEQVMELQLTKTFEIGRDRSGLAGRGCRGGRAATAATVPVTAAADDELW